MSELNLRPGDFAGNARKLLAAVRAAAKRGDAAFVYPADAIRGGDCGSLAKHPDFLAREETATRRFLAAAAKVPHAPKLRRTSHPLAPALVAAGPDVRHPFLGHPERVFELQVEGLKRRLSAIGCRHVVIGLSGGLDSTLALLVAVIAFTGLDFDLSGIHVYTMPGFGTTVRTKGNAELLAEGLGLSLETIDVTAACLRHFQDIAHPVDRHDVVFENAQARMRTLVLMDKANQVGGIVLGTGDMSEIALGWSTYNGDHMSMYGVNAGVPKTAVREVCAFMAEMFDASGNSSLAKAAAAVRGILATPVSPELLPAKDGEIQQKTEEKIGPYELHDFFLWRYCALNEGRRDVMAAARRAFKGEYDAPTISKWFGVFERRLLSQAFKRNCAPDGTQVWPLYFGPNAWHSPGDLALG